MQISLPDVGVRLCMYDEALAMFVFAILPTVSEFMTH